MAAFLNTLSSEAAVAAGKWELADGNWKFYNEKHEAYKGWVNTASGWYYLDPSTGVMATKWQKINGVDYYFDTSEDGAAGKMHTGWYRTPDGKWYFFNNTAGDSSCGGMLTGWQWIDGYCYYFDTSSGDMFAGKTTPDGYKTNESGRWTDNNGVVQYVAGKGFLTKASAGSSAGTARRSRSSGGSGGGGSRGGSGGNSKNPSNPTEPSKPDNNNKKPDNKESTEPSKSDKPDDKGKLITDEQKIKLVNCVAEANQLIGKHGDIKDSETDWKELKALADSAVSSVFNKDTTSEQAEKLISELQSLIKKLTDEGKTPKEYNKKYPTHIIVEYEDGSNSRIDLNKDNFVYSIAQKSSKIKSAVLYDKTDKIVDAIYNDVTSSWEMKLDSIPVPSGYDLWGYTLYRVKEEPKDNPQTTELADGEWYGTATWSRYHLQRGPNIVKVTIKDGKIEKVDSVVYTDDDELAGSYVIKRNRLLKKLEGLENTDEITKQLNKHSGEIYDAVSGATETAKGHISAVDNALARSKKFKSDGKAQNINYIEFVKRPEARATGSKLDLSDSVLKVHLKGGEIKNVNFDKFSEYSIITDPLHDSALPSIGEFVYVHFKNENSLIDIQSEVQLQKKITKKYPTHIIISYENGNTKKIDLRDDEYRYTVEAAGTIKEMAIFDADHELTKGAYDNDLKQWRFDLKNVPHDGYDGWGFDIYAVIVDSSHDTSDIASFDLETNMVKKSYYVGDSLNIDGLSINAITKNGNNRNFYNWEACKTNGFRADPDNNYVFKNDDIGTKKVSISREIDGNTVTKTFDVVVSDPKKDAPAKIELYDNSELVQTVNVDFDSFKASQGYLKILDVEIPKKYEGKWNKNTFTVKAYNAAGDLLNTRIRKIGIVLAVDLPDYQAFHENGGYVWLGFKFADTPPQTTLADGQWYGTGSWSLYYAKRGPDVVKIEIENGKIKDAVSVVYTEDSGFNFEKGMNILDKVKGLDNTESIAKQLKERKGEAYDAVSGATNTAKGCLSAVDNALERSKKYKSDAKEQPINYMEFKVRPDAQATGKTLDLSKTVLKLHMKSGDTKEVAFNDFNSFGITTNPLHGSVLPSVGQNVLVHFKNEESLTDIPSEIQVQKKNVLRYPTHITVSYENNETKRIDLDNNNFRYKLSGTNKVKKMTIFDGNVELAEAALNDVTKEWQFDMSKVEVGSDYTGWGFNTYIVEVDVIQEDSPIASFEIDDHKVKRSYKIGEKLNLEELIIKATTKNGTKKNFYLWKDAKEAGFVAQPDDGYQFTATDSGKKNVNISLKVDGSTITKSFEIEVGTVSDNAPTTIEIYNSSDELVRKIDIQEGEFDNKEGKMVIPNVELPKEYENWTVSSLKFKAYNAKHTDLNINVERRKNTICVIHFPDYAPANGEGYIMLGLKFVENEDIKTVRGESKVERFNYQAKVIVKYNAKTGEIVSVEDDATNPKTSGNKRYWNKAVKIFERMRGKTRENLDTVDTISHATYSSKAIIKAAKEALPTNEKPDNTNMEMLDIVTDGKSHIYYYKKYDPFNPNAELLVKGEKVNDKATLVRNEGGVPQLYYYVEDGQKLTGNLYGTADIPYRYFYYGEKSRNKKPFPLNGDPSIGQEPVAVQALNFMGDYDAVSSATTKNYGKFDMAVYSDKTEDGYKITGVKTPVQIDAELYAKVKLLGAASVQNNNIFIPAVESMSGVDSNTGIKREVTSTELPAYKIFYRDSTLSEMMSGETDSELHINTDSLNIKVTDQSPYNDYQINIDGLPGEIKGNKNVLGVVINVDGEEYNAKTYGLSQLDNIWTDAGQIGFSVEKRSKGGKNAHRRFALLGGHKISRITYLLGGYKKVVIDNLDLYLGKRLNENAKPEILSKTGFKEGKPAKVTFDISKLPYTEYEVNTLKFGTGEDAKLLEKGSDFSYDIASNTLSIMSTADTGEGMYTIIFEDHNKTGGYISKAYDFEIGKGSEPEPEKKTVLGEAKVEEYDYTVKVNVTYDTGTGIIENVEDAGTEPGDNESFWHDALEMLSKFKGKKKTDIDGIDGVSGATKSSRAIKKAVKNAVSGGKMKALSITDSVIEEEMTTEDSVKPYKKDIDDIETKPGSKIETEDRLKTESQVVDTEVTLKPDEEKIVQKSEQLQSDDKPTSDIFAETNGITGFNKSHDESSNVGGAGINSHITPDKTFSPSENLKTEDDIALYIK